MATWFNDDVRRWWLLVYRCEQCVADGHQGCEIRLAGSAIHYYDMSRNRSDDLITYPSVPLRCARHGQKPLKLIKAVIVKAAGSETPIPDEDWQRHGPGGPGRFDVRVEAQG